MGAGCVCPSWTCRPVWPLFMILASFPWMSDCSESPAAVVGKVYPRGNHWAVGHLMGKKSIERLPELQLSPDSDDLAAAGVTERLEALIQQRKQKQTTPQTARLLRLHSFREEDRALREMSHLLLLALKLRENGST